MHRATLPHGVLRDGTRRCDALLRAPNGDDEAILAELLVDTSTPERASALLAHCVEELGGQRAGLDDVRALVVGDREALLLHLRAAAFGERVACVVDCPACAQLMDLELAIGDLLVDGYADAAAEHRLTLGAGEAVRFRLPTGADLEAAARATDDESGAAMLLERCVLGDRRLDDDARVALEEELERLDPQADLHIAAACPSCGEDVDATVDPAVLLIDELAASAEVRFRRAHTSLEEHAR
jgi:hypothetical protein